MVQQLVVPKRKMGIIYNYTDYTKKTPFFQKPIKITLGNHTNDTYFLHRNIVFKGKQILALTNEQSPETIFLVEAVIENEQLKCIVKLPDEYIASIGKIMEENLV